MRIYLPAMLRIALQAGGYADKSVKSEYPHHPNKISNPHLINYDYKNIRH